MSMNILDSLYINTSYNNVHSDTRPYIAVVKKQTNKKYSRSYRYRTNSMSNQPNLAKTGK